ncbi:MAG: ATP-binding protein, partial [Candidatus Promineofilum sp.]|nr:ATP-binding protein [Promineifilum sp.]
DSAGQVLAYVSLQAQAIRQSVRDGKTAAAEAQLIQLAAAAQGAHVDVRESILSLKAVAAEDQPFAAALTRYLDTYAARYDLPIKLTVADGLDNPFAPEASAQVLRVVQEALTNARKHGQAHHVGVTVGRANGSARVVITDDGQGFDPGAVGDGHYGLAIMHERMAQVGGRLAIESQPGAGTRVALEAPLIHRGN